MTEILAAAGAGDPEAAGRLLPLVYEELRRLAHDSMAKEPAGHTLQPTALVHEAYLRLVGDQDMRWKSRGHFFGAAAEAIRRILVEKARQKLGPRRGGGVAHVALNEEIDAAVPRSDEILHLHTALDDLANESPIKAELVKLRYFAGLGHQEAAEALGLSRSTADRYWAYAKAYLYAALQDQEEN